MDDDIDGWNELISVHMRCKQKENAAHIWLREKWTNERSLSEDKMNKKIASQKEDKHIS